MKMKISCMFDEDEEIIWQFRFRPGLAPLPLPPQGAPGQPEKLGGYPFFSIVF